MSRWRDLPESLDPRLRHLVAELRAHKDRSGLSIAALAHRTGFGKSSWDRYLNGRALPPEEAVEALAQVCEVAAAPLLELRELATTGAAEAEAEAGVETVRPIGATPRTPVPWTAILLSSVTTSLVMLAGLVLLAPWEDSTPSAPAATATERPAAGDVHPELGVYKYSSGTTYECDVRRDDDGLLYAGYSRTRTALLDKNAYRWAVVEAQCLLEQHGASPGVVDGAFGTNTDRAVRQVQTEAKIAVDGVIGPDTWKVLRK